MPAKKRWIKSAIKRPGAFAAKAKRAGKSTLAYARAKKSAPGRLGKQARLAITLMTRIPRRGRRAVRTRTRRG